MKIPDGMQGPAFTEQARGVTNWRRERRWEMVELKDRPAIGDEGKLQFHASLMLMQHPFASWEIQNLKVHM